MWCLFFVFFSKSILNCCFSVVEHASADGIYDSNTINSGVVSLLPVLSGWQAALHEKAQKMIKKIAYCLSICGETLEYCLKSCIFLLVMSKLQHYLELQ